MSGNTGPVAAAAATTGGAPSPSIGEAGVRAALAICGCGATLIDSIVDDGIDDMDLLCRLTKSDVVSLARTISSATLNRGGVKFGITRHYTKKFYMGITSLYL